MYSKIKVPIIIGAVLVATTVTAVAVFARSSPPPSIGQTIAEYQVYPFHPATLQTLSQLLGIPTQEITVQLGQGKTLLDIAAAKGVAEEKLVAALIAPEAELLQVQVKNGFLTDAQAKARVDWLRARAAQTVRLSWTATASAQGTYPYGMMDPANCPMLNGWTGGATGAPGQGWGMMGGGMMGSGTFGGGMMGGGMMGRW